MFWGKAAHKRKDIHSKGWGLQQLAERARVLADLGNRGVEFTLRVSKLHSTQSSLTHRSSVSTGARWGTKQRANLHRKKSVSLVFSPWLIHPCAADLQTDGEIHTCIGLSDFLLSRITGLRLVPTANTRTERVTWNHKYWGFFKLKLS